jgi:hypothetical protein
VYLKPGDNKIITSKIWENRDEGYSVIPIFGEGNIIVAEEDENYFAEKFIKFGEYIFFRKKHNSNIISVNVQKPSDSNFGFLYSFTTKYHDK